MSKAPYFHAIRMLLLVRDLAGLELGAPEVLVTWFFPVQGEKVQWTWVIWEAPSLDLKALAGLSFML